MSLSVSVKTMTYLIIASTLICHLQARPRPEPVMADLARAMIPQVPPCYRLFPFYYSIGGALARIFAPFTFETQFNTCFPEKKGQAKL